MSSREDKIILMQEGGILLSNILRKLVASIHIGATGLDIDRIADNLIESVGGKPSFKMVPGYRWSTCICTNSIVVHGIPNDSPLKDGDIVGIDVGMFYKGYHTDVSDTVVVGQTNEDTRQFLDAGAEALSLAIRQAQVGNRVGDISKAIQQTIEQRGYSIVRTLVGHGVGEKLHQEPEVPGFVSGSIGRSPLLSTGMTLAIEVIYSRGKPEVVYAGDGWTIRTKDGSLAGLFEKTIAITADGPFVLTG